MATNERIRQTIRSQEAPYPPQGVEWIHEVNGEEVKEVWKNGAWTPVKSSGGGGGEPQVQSDWDENDNTAPSFIKNKPTIGYTTIEVSFNTQTQEISLSDEALASLNSALAALPLSCIFLHFKQDAYEATMSIIGWEKDESILVRYPIAGQEKNEILSLY